MLEAELEQLVEVGHLLAGEMQRLQGHLYTHRPEADASLRRSSDNPLFSTDPPSADKSLYTTRPRNKVGWGCCLCGQAEAYMRLR